MTCVLCVLGGLVAGGLVVRLVASARATKSLTAKIENLARQANTAEGRASGPEGTIVELRAQNQKASEDFTKIREQLASENGAEIERRTRTARRDLSDLVSRGLIEYARKPHPGFYREKT